MNQYNGCESMKEGIENECTPNEAESQAIFISYVALHTMELIGKLGEELKKLIITSSQTTMWRLLRLAHIDDEIKGYGKLFQY